MKRAALAIAGLVLAAQAFACGHCVEDRVAAAYDHGVVMHALERRHEVAFLAIEGKLAANRKLRNALTAALESTRGVDRGTSRVALEQASLSFAYDPEGQQPLAAIIRSLQRKLASSGLRLSMLRVVNDAPMAATTAGPVASASVAR